jgi:hypothetical protein
VPEGKVQEAYHAYVPRDPAQTTLGGVEYDLLHEVVSAMVQEGSFFIGADVVNPPRPGMLEYHIILLVHTKTGIVLMAYSGRTPAERGILDEVIIEPRDVPVSTSVDSYTAMLDAEDALSEMFLHSTVSGNKQLHISWPVNRSSITVSIQDKI